MTTPNSPAPTAPASGPGTLPVTGSTDTLTVIAAISALGLGIGLVRVARRPRTI